MLERDPFAELDDLIGAGSDDRAAPGETSPTIEPGMAIERAIAPTTITKHDASPADGLADLQERTVHLAAENAMLIQKQVNAMLRTSDLFDPSEVKALSAVAYRPLEMEQRERLAKRDENQLLTVEINFISSGEIQIDVEPPKPVIEAEAVEVIEPTKAEAPTTAPAAFDFEFEPLEVARDE